MRRVRSLAVLHPQKDEWLEEREEERVLEHFVRKLKKQQGKEEATIDFSALHSPFRSERGCLT